MHPDCRALSFVQKLRVFFGDMNVLGILGYLIRRVVRSRRNADGPLGLT